MVWYQVLRGAFVKSLNHTGCTYYLYCLSVWSGRKVPRVVNSAGWSDLGSNPKAQSTLNPKPQFQPGSIDPASGLLI